MSVFSIWISDCGFHVPDFLSAFLNVDFRVWISYLDFLSGFMNVPMELSVGMV